MIEAYLEATLAMREPDQLAAHGERLVQLRKDYDERKAFWVTSSLSADLKTALVSKSDAEVQKFWKLLSDQLLPALKSKDMAAAERAYAQLKDAYTAHRAVIDGIVESANKQNADMEKLAAERDSSILYILLGVSAAVLAFIAAGLLGVALGVVRPIVRMTDTMQKLATGDLAADIPFAHRQDEVGSMAGALLVFKQGAIENSRLREEQLQKEQEAATAKRGPCTRWPRPSSARPAARSTPRARRRKAWSGPPPACPRSPGRCLRNCRRSPRPPPRRWAARRPSRPRPKN